MPLILFLASVPRALGQDIDLSKSRDREFPTHSVSVQGCNAAYDNPDQTTPDFCWPFPVTLEVLGVRVDSVSKQQVLAAAMHNKSGHTIDLPRLLDEPKKGGKTSFISLLVYSPPKAETAQSVSYAFADSKLPSSSVHLRPHSTVVYLLPFGDTRAGGGTARGRLIRVLLRAYSLDRKTPDSESISTQLGNEMSSPIFVLTQQ